MAAAAAVLTAALTFLSREAARWEPENHCFSCHNNGDAARALFRAGRTTGTLGPTVEFLRRPRLWDRPNAAPFPGSGRLARVQFAAALAEAARAGAIRDRAPLSEAAALLAADQDAGGAWPVDSGGLAPAPATYGTPLATYMARDVLKRAGDRRFAESIARATRWIERAQPASVTDAAALLLGAPSRADCLALILGAQNGDGGWGPQRGTPSEAFDTALVVLALRGKGAAAARGRAYMERTQGADGAWAETTRPAGGVSYAERISTAAWVAFALAVTGR